MTQPVQVSVIGCGNISSAYFSHAPAFSVIEVVACADLDGFDGRVQISKGGEFEDVPSAFVSGYGRIVGVADMAYAIRSGRPHRASADLAYTVLDAMQGFLDSSRTGQAYTLTAPFERPAAMPADRPFGTLDA